MTLRTAAATVLVLTAMTWAQNGSPAGSASPVALNSRKVIATSNAKGLAENARAQNSARQRMEEMGATLAKMHALLKQMQAKNSASATKDPSAKANLEMWVLMLSDMDKQYEQLRSATQAREDMEARRAAMYKQAEERAATAARNAKQNTGPAQDGPGVAAERSAPASVGATPATPAPSQSTVTPPASSTSPN
ncbi:MAG TPA: hypothetical protein VJP02_26350 [Candidatus Sulfotelmatobacter sp.]|nr:hypothetical protein [Candidatus Sulfotelmatobacter sp.]